MTHLERFLLLSMILTLMSIAAFSQELSYDSIKERLTRTETELQVYKSKLDSLLSAQNRNKKLIEEELNSSSFYPEYKWIKVFPYTKFSSGFMATDTETHSGLFSGAIEVIGFQANFYIKKQIDGHPLAADLSPLISLGWGPMLVADNTIYNYLFLNGGISVNQFSSTVSYSGTFGVNTSGDKATQFLYGLSISLEDIQTPVFFSLLFGDKGFQYVAVLGLKIPLTYLLPHRSERF